jgi:hypothetical protein
MIWNHGNPSEKEPELLAAMTAEMEASCADGTLTEESLKDILRAVDYYLRRDGGGAAVESRHVVMLVSKAMASLGEAAAARRLLVLGTGLVRSAQWEVSRGNAMWILDLRRMTVKDDLHLDIFFYTCLNMVIDAIADLWDGTGGNGVLGLRHVCETATGLLGGGQKAAIQGTGRLILDSCRRRLDKLRSERGWETAPEVMNMDLHESQ